MITRVECSERNRFPEPCAVTKLRSVICCLAVVVTYAHANACVHASVYLVNRIPSSRHSAAEESGDLMRLL